MSVKLKKDLRLRDYLDLIAKQNEAIIDQLMIDPNAMTSAFRLTSHKQYKESIKEYTIKAKVEEVKEDEWKGGDRIEVKKDDTNYVGIFIFCIILLFGVVLIMLRSQ